MFLGLDLGLAGLRKLKTQPPGFMKIPASSDAVWSGDHVPPAESSIFQTIYDLVRQSSFPAWLT